MNLERLKVTFRESIGMINPFYKFLVGLVYVGGPISALFVLVLAYISPDTTTWISVIILLSLVIDFKLGPSPFFLINCSWIYFRFHKFGMWLPIVAYLIALTILGLQMAADKVLTSKNDNEGGIVS